MKNDLKECFLNKLIMEIVGLENFVQDDVNKIIAKFVGFKPHPVTKDLKRYITRYERWNIDKNATFSKYTVDALHCRLCNCLLKGIMLEMGNEFCIKCDC